MDASCKSDSCFEVLGHIKYLVQKSLNSKSSFAISSKQTFVIKHFCLSIGNPNLSNTILLDGMLSFSVKSGNGDSLNVFAFDKTGIFLSNGSHICPLTKNTFGFSCSISSTKKNTINITWKFEEWIQFLFSLEEVNSLHDAFFNIISEKRYHLEQMNSGSFSSKIHLVNFKNFEFELLDSNVKMIRPLLCCKAKDVNIIYKTVPGSKSVLIQGGSEIMSFDSQFNCWESIIEPVWYDLNFGAIFSDFLGIKYRIKAEEIRSL